jgi:hypothetical protein
MDINELHSFLRKATIRICELPDEEIKKLDEEIGKELNDDV